MSTRTITARILVPIGAVALAASVLPLVTAQATPPATATACVDAGLVWVHVETETKVSGACAEKFATASEALVSSGLGTETGDFVTTVDGVTADGTNARQFWAIWSMDATQAKTSDWQFSQVAAPQLKLTAGSVLGFQLWPDWNITTTAPKTNPLLEGTQTPAPTPTATAESSDPVGLPGAGV